MDSIGKMGMGGVGGAVPGGAPGAKDTPGVPSGESVDRLNDLLNTTQQPQQPAEAGAVADPQAAEAAPDRLRDAVNSINQRLDQAQSDTLAVFQKEDVTQMDLIKANFAMLESSTIISAASKVTEKITQGVKNLQQG